MFPQQYKLKPEAYAAARKTVLLPILPLVLLVGVPYAYSLYAGAAAKPINWTEVSLIAGAICLFLVIRITRLLRNYKKAYSEFILIIQHDRITGQNLQLQPIDLSWIELTDVIKNTDGTIWLRSAPGSPMIAIPAAVEHKDQLLAALAAIAPVRENPSTFFTRHSKVIIFSVFAVLLVFIYSTNKIVVGITGPVLDAVFIWAFVLMHRAKQAGSNTLRVKWVLLLPIIGVIIKMYLVLTANS